MQTHLELEQESDREMASPPFEDLPFEQLILFEKAGPYVRIYSGRIVFVIIDCFYQSCFFYPTIDEARHLCCALELKCSEVVRDD
jgi:hypothetical protein